MERTPAGDGDAGDEGPGGGDEEGESVRAQRPAPVSAPDWDAAPVNTGIIRRVARPDRRYLLVLVLAAIATRLIWVLWVHPSEDYVFSDMRKYVERAQDLAVHGLRKGVRPLAWQTWGTHYLLALPLKLLGKDALGVAAVMWALMSAAAVPAAYLLSCRVSTRRFVPKLVGVLVLLWHPNLSNAGYFLSETPFLCFQLWSTYFLVVLLQDGRRAFAAGLCSAIAFAVRPQSALFFLLVLGTWGLCRRRLAHVLPRHLLMVALPLLLVLGFSFWRFERHTGYWAGVAENANMNLTAGRCHNIVTQAFKTESRMQRSIRKGKTTDGRRVSLPAFRVLARRVDKHWPGSPFGLRPAFGSETIRFVGYIGDPQIHRDIRKQCYDRTGLLEQARYSVVNMSLLWFVGHQWPEIERGRKYFYPPLLGYRYAYQILFWIPSLIGMVWALRRIRWRPAIAFCALQLVTSMTIAAIFFGSVRLRTPYDPYAILLAVEGWLLVIPWLRARIAAKPTGTPLPSARERVTQVTED